MNFSPFSMFPTAIEDYITTFSLLSLRLLLFSLTFSLHFSLNILLTARSCRIISEQTIGEALTAHIWAFFSLLVAFTANWHKSRWREIKLNDVTLQHVKLGVLSCTAFAVFMLPPQRPVCLRKT